MESRIDRYQSFIADEYIAGLMKADEFSLDGLTPAFRSWIAGGVDRVVFTGMGCSAIVSDLIRGFLLNEGLGLDIHVVNDYNFFTLIPDRYIDDPRTLIIVSSYSGHSSEPILALERLSRARDRTLLLTSGGRLAELGRMTGTSVALWELSRPDREYPLFHVTQYFAILIEMFRRLEVLPADFNVDFAGLASALEARRSETSRLGAILADAAREANILMIAQPLWHDSMLKLCKMHLNEIAMVPASRNFFHEFCHSEVATLSDPDRRHCLLAFADECDDDYTTAKLNNLLGLLTSPVPQNAIVRACRVPMYGASFLEKLFSTLDVVQHMTLSLARFREVQSRDLISESAGNTWYHSTTIAAEYAGADV